MAGSYRSIVNEHNEFCGTDLIENLGDAHIVLHDCWQIIRSLGGTKEKIYEIVSANYARDTGRFFPLSFEEYWWADMS